MWTKPASWTTGLRTLWRRSSEANSPRWHAPALTAAGTAPASCSSAAHCRTTKCRSTISSSCCRPFPRPCSACSSTPSARRMQRQHAGRRCSERLIYKRAGQGVESVGCKRNGTGLMFWRGAGRLGKQGFRGSSTGDEAGGRLENPLAEAGQNELGGQRRCDSVTLARARAAGCTCLWKCLLERGWG